MSLLLLLGAALAQDEATQELPEPPREALVVSGFVRPAVSLRVIPDAVPADQLNFGAEATTAGIVFAGDPAEKWSYKVYLLVGADTFPAVTGVKMVDRNNDGLVDGVDTETTQALGNIMRETSVTWRPTQPLGLKLGRMPLPFTSQSQSPDTALLFPQRSGPTGVFIADDDLGGLLQLDAGEGRFLAQGGLFNGTGVGPNTSSTRGVLYLARVDLNPLGAFDFDETDPLAQDFRLGMGLGLAWHPYRSFDAAGYSDVQVSDFRGALSLRMAWSGVSIGTELLHRQQLDTLTDRPVVATGGYAQLGWYSPAGIEPIGRFGQVVEDRSFDPRTTRWLDLGANLYPLFQGERPDAIKVTLQYVGEDRITEGERAHGAQAALQVQF